MGNDDHGGRVLFRVKSLGGTLRLGHAAPAFDDPVVVFNLDYLGGDPNGSLPQAYLMLVSDSNRPGE